MQKPLQQESISCGSVPGSGKLRRKHGKDEDQEGKTGKVNVIVCRNFNRALRYRIKILRIALYKSKPDEIKIEKMKNEKSKN